MNAPILAARGITVRFGGVRALDGIDLEVRPGQIVGLIGPNGAGKTTFVDAVTGFVPCAGRVEIDGHDVTRLRPHARVRAGIGRTWQAVELFGDLTVAENLAVSARRQSVWASVGELFRNPDPAALSVGEALERVGIGDLAEAIPDELSEGQRKLAGIARAFAGAPKVVFLDEPAAGLDTGESAVLGKQLRALGDDGTPMLLIDHDIGFVFGICDHVVVLEFGQVIAQGTPAEVRGDPRVVAAYLGSAAAAERVLEEDK